MLKDMNEAQEKAKEFAEKAKETAVKAQEKAKEFADKAKEFAEKAKETAVKAQEKAKEFADKAKEVAEKAKETTVKEKAKEFADKIAEAIRNIKREDVEKALKSSVATHIYTGIIGAIMMWALLPNNGPKTFEDHEDNALYNLHHEYVERSTGDMVTAENFNPDSLNRAYFDPNTFPTINWRSYSKHKISVIYGEIAAKEMALIIDRINHGESPKTVVDLEDMYCNKAVTQAMENAAQRTNFEETAKIKIFDLNREADRKYVLKNGYALISHFKERYADKVPGAIVQNPQEEDFATISIGSVVRMGDHSKMYMGFGFVDANNKTFVPDAQHGRPVVASAFDETFMYFDGVKCTVVDVPKVIQYKMEQESGRRRQGR